MMIKFLKENGPNATWYPTSSNDLLWREDLGIGYLKSNGYTYDGDYWQKYQSYVGNEIGKRITDFRIDFVERNCKPLSRIRICDVGIGSGEFVRAIHCKGYDINPEAERWLREEGRWGDPYVQDFDVITLWDVLEHIDDPGELLGRADHVFTSLPIHLNVEACLASKHLRPDEHIWQFTDRGIRHFMGMHGFIMRDVDNGETRAGREDIMSYYFERVRP